MGTQLNYDFSQVNPVFEGGSFLPVSPPNGWLAILTGDEGWKPVKSGQGNMLILNGVCQEGPAQGQEFVLRFNLQHNNPKAVAAAAQELAALGHVLGLPGRIDVTDQLFNKPFRVVSEQQVDDKGAPTQYTQLATNGIRDVNGNMAGKAGSGPQTAQPAPQAPAFPPQGLGPGPGFQPQAAPAAPFGQPAAPAAAPFGAPQGQSAPFGAPSGAAPFGAPAGAVPFGSPAPASGAPAWATQPGR
jgi:hypothetical protein